MQTIIKDSIIEREKIVVKDSLIYMPGDTLEIGFAIPCPGGEKIDLKKTSKQLNLSIKSDSKGNLTVRCASDSLLKVIARLTTIMRDKEHHKSNVQTITVTRIEKVPAYKIPKWVWVLLAGNAVYFAFKFRNPILLFAKSLIIR